MNECMAELNNSNNNNKHIYIKSFINKCNIYIYVIIIWGRILAWIYVHCFLIENANLQLIVFALRNDHDLCHMKVRVCKSSLHLI